MTLSPPTTETESGYLASSQGAETFADKRTIWLSQIATTLAHEIGNPLQSIRGCLDLSLEDQALSIESREYLDMACAEIDRLSALLIRLRELYDTNAPERSDVDLDSLLNTNDSQR
jgi:nitrogen-specific signal transduction histidine kinase